MSLISNNHFNSVFLPIDSTPIALVTAGTDVVITILKIFIANTGASSRTCSFWVVAKEGAAPIGPDNRMIVNQKSVSAPGQDEIVGPIVLTAGMSLYGGASVASKLAVSDAGYDETLT